MIVFLDLLYKLFLLDLINVHSFLNLENILFTSNISFGYLHIKHLSNFEL